jgi:hypothetical protein
MKRKASVLRCPFAQLLTSNWASHWKVEPSSNSQTLNNRLGKLLRAK